MAELFERHDRALRDSALSFGPDDGNAMRRRLRAAFDRFIDVRDITDHEIAALMRRAEIDIAVDLTGFTKRFPPRHSRAAAPAPVQVNYLGYPGTMGADYIDYIIADAT